jgi:hypothetical protein
VLAQAYALKYQKNLQHLVLCSTFDSTRALTAGDHDESDPSIAREMHEKIGASKLVILPDSGHMTFVDQPVLFRRAVDDFLHDRGGQ